MGIFIRWRKYEMGAFKAEPASGYVVAAIILGVLFLCFLIFLVYTLLRIARSGEQRRERRRMRRSLAETIKNQRTRCGMTQEFVAESVGVSRQAVSKWETGASEPSTTNLIALSKLYSVPVDDLINGIE
jgi:DNA-binding XRE family transcriptional regulator